MKAALLVLAFVITSSLLNAQTGLYRTYEDYQNNNLEKVTSIEWVSYSGGRYRLHYKDSTGKKDKLKYSDIWGFIYEGNLFRSETTTEGFVRVLVQGKLVYYENAYFHLEALVEKKSSIEISSFTSSSIMLSFISTTLNSEILVIPHLAVGLSIYKKPWKKFIEENPQGKDFFECVNRNINYLKTRECAYSKLKLDI